MATSHGLQWSRLQSEAVINAKRTYSWRALRLQWSRLQSEAVISGAAQLWVSSYLLQWSRLQSEAVIGLYHDIQMALPWASMEPPPIGGGNGLIRETRRQVMPCFNGAASNRRR